MLKTKKRDLRTGVTVWQAKTPKIPLDSIKKPHPFYEVVVVGAGISGALSTFSLCDGKRKVLVVDRRSPATGSTSASTALIQWEVDVPLGELCRKVGKARAVAAYKETHRAVQRLARLIKAEKIPCDFHKRDTLLLAGSEMGPLALKNETALRRRNALPSRFLDADELQQRYGFAREGAILSAGSIEIDPRRLTLELLKRAVDRGAELLFPADVTRIDATASGAFLTLSSGDVVATRKVVAATGYEAMPGIPKSKYDLISTWALATVKQKPEALWPGRALVWEAADPYLYFRTTADNRIIVGGEDASFSDPKRRDKLINVKSKKILQKLAKLLPEAKLDPAYEWAGTFAESPTGLPALGPLAEAPSVFGLLGSGGNGITYSVIAAQMVADWVADKPNKLAKTFGF